MKELLARAIHREIQKVIKGREVWVCEGVRGTCCKEYDRFPHEGCSDCGCRDFRHTVVGDGKRSRAELEEQERGMYG